MFGLLRRQPAIVTHDPRWQTCYLLGVLSTLALAAGCVQEMANQPRLEPYEASEFFDNGMATREPIPGTVARGHEPQELERHSQHFLTATVDGQLTNELPEEVLEKWSYSQLLARGRERYGVFCVHCHDLVGSGQGIVPQRGFPEPPTYHSQRLRSEPLGYIYRVIKDGKGRMAPHGGLVPPADRWAIAAYVRALQFSQHAQADFLQQQDLEQLQTLSD